MKYYRVNNRGAMTPLHVYDKRKKRIVCKGFTLYNQLFTPKEREKYGIPWFYVDEIELKKSQIKIYPSGTRFEKGVWF